MKFRFFSLLALMGVFAFVAAAADITGKWTAEIPGRNGNTQSVTFNFKADGAALSGNMSTPRGEAPISEGKVDGNNVSFNTVMKMQDNEVTMKYKGVVDGSTIKFTRTVNFNGNERTAEFTAKKQ
jgi:hypothetical protein